MKGAEHWRLPAMLAATALGLVAIAGMAGAQSQAGQAGQAGFAANCAACHQEDGKGVEGAFPALAGNPFLQGPESQPIGVVLNGRNAMPAFAGDLSDEQIAQILSYARAAWGNSAAPVAPAAVAQERARIAR